MKSLALKIPPGLKFLAEENGKPCHKHILGGQEVPGCTSVSALFQDDGWKFAWPPKLMSEIVWNEAKEKNKMLISHGIIDFDGVMWNWDELAEVLLKGKNAWRKKRDKAADSGTIAHKIIEEYLNGKAPGIGSESVEVQNSCLEFMAWEGLTKPEWCGSEIQVASEKYRFAGILDALAKINGKLTLVDFKTSGDIKSDYAIQLAGLCICLEEMGVVVDQRAILHLPKTGHYEFRIINGDLTKDKLAFLVALEFYRHRNLFLARCKDEHGRNISVNSGQRQRNLKGARKLKSGAAGTVPPKEGFDGILRDGAAGEAPISQV